MNTEHTEFLLKKYPNMMQQAFWPKEQSCLSWLFECGDGWFDLLCDCCDELYKVDPQIMATQIKEKFGTLRFYYHPSDYKLSDKLDHIINTYEEISSKTCEICGEPGTLKHKGWCSVRCKRCLDKEMERNINV
jgi:hypothetical protein